MTGLKTALAAISLLLTTLLTGCGPDQFIPYTSTPVAPATATGNWSFTGYYATKGSNIEPYDIGGSLIETGSQLSGIFHLSLPCFGSYAADVPYTGTLDSENHLNIVSSPVNGEVLTLAGTLSGNTALTEGVLNAIGSCTEALNISLTGVSGVRVPNLTAAWTSQGAPILAGTGTSLSATEQLTQSPTPDAHGDFALTGAITVQNSPCFTHGTLQPGSFLSGVLGQQVILLDDGSTLILTLQVYNVFPSQTKPTLALYPGTITGGQCDGPVYISLR